MIIFSSLISPFFFFFFHKSFYRHSSLFFYGAISFLLPFFQQPPLPLPPLHFPLKVSHTSSSFLSSEMPTIHHTDYPSSLFLLSSLSFIQSFIYSSIHNLSAIHRPLHSFTKTFTHSLIHSLIIDLLIPTIIQLKFFFLSPFFFFLPFSFIISFSSLLFFFSFLPSYKFIPLICSSCPPLAISLLSVSSISHVGQPANRKEKERK